MKNLIGILTVLILFTFEVFAHDWKVVDPVTLGGLGWKTFEIDEDGEASVKGVLIKRLEIGKDNCIFSLFNKSDVAIKPDVHFNLYNKYGIKTGSCRIKWIFDTVKPGSKESETVKIGSYPLVEIFKNSNISLPPDFGKSIHAVLKLD